MDFNNYYGDPFRTDLSAVATHQTCPHSDGDEVVIQPRTLSTENPVIRHWKPDQIALFANAFFFTVLVDQVCYTYYRGNYSRFRELTMYPKFHGDCPGGCWWNLHPGRILRAIGSAPGSASNWSGQIKISDNALDVMQNEVLEFFNVHMPTVDGKQFWRRCVSEIPRRSPIQ